MLDERFHNCKSCSYFSKGKCTKISEEFDISVNGDLYELAESGKLSEAITEGLKLPKMAEVESLLSDSGISQKKQKQILQAIRANLEDFIPTMVEGVDNSVSHLIINLDESKQKEVQLTDPESFYCKYFM